MKTISNIIRGLFSVLLVVVLMIVILQKVTNNKLTIGNIYIFQVASESMMPAYRVGDVIIVKKTAPSKLKIGDAVTYLGKASNLAGLVITHEIVHIEENDGKYNFITKGLLNTVEDPMITENDIYGKVIYHTIIFSFIGRLMTNVFAYYFIFVVVGICIAYDIISLFMKSDEDDLLDDDIDEDESDIEKEVEEDIIDVEEKTTGEIEGDNPE